MRMLLILLSVTLLTSCGEPWVSVHPTSRTACTEETAKKAGEAYAFCLAIPRQGTAVYAYTARECGESAFSIYCIAERKQK